MRHGGERERVNRGCSRILSRAICSLCIITFLKFPAFAGLEPDNVLILVNAESPVSCYVAKLYLEYHPGCHVLELPGFQTECDADDDTEEIISRQEIISRTDYDILIAQPVRDYITDNNLFNTIRVILTTAGMPYRINDSTISGVVEPAGCCYWVVGSRIYEIDAASVESELSCLWYIDSDYMCCNRQSRIVNPFQGYRNVSIVDFEKTDPALKVMQWCQPPASSSGTPPWMEGDKDVWLPWEPPGCCGTYNRSFGPGDIYLTCRLDGPKPVRDRRQVVFAIREMLERSKRASTEGINPFQVSIVIDDSPGKETDENQVYNVSGPTPFIDYIPGESQPPGACTYLELDDYRDCYTTLTNGGVISSILNVNLIQSSFVGPFSILLDRRENTKTSQADLDMLLDPDQVDVELLQRAGDQYAIAHACYGRYNNDGVNLPTDYILHGGPGGSPLFNLSNGAVFTAIESLNGVTLFSDVATSNRQAKVIDFLEIGGTGVIGHAFEPVSDATIDNFYFFYNLFSDIKNDQGDFQPDGIADMTFVEAAWTGIPYLSWSEVVIGDPLMRIKCNPQATKTKAWIRLDGDANRDHKVNIHDLIKVRSNFGGSININDINSINSYNDSCDYNKDGKVDITDLIKTRQSFGSVMD